jgi:hypothetical protein
LPAKAGKPSLLNSLADSRHSHRNQPSQAQS